METTIRNIDQENHRLRQEIAITGRRIISCNLETLKITLDDGRAIYLDECERE